MKMTDRWDLDDLPEITPPQNSKGQNIKNDDKKNVEEKRTDNPYKMGTEVSS